MAEAQFSKTDFFSSIPEFVGDPQELPRFISLVEFMLDDLSAAAKPNLYRHLGFKLKGKAFDIYEELVEPSWVNLKLKLEQHFLVQKSMTNLQNELQQITQGRGEDVKA